MAVRWQLIQKKAKELLDKAEVREAPVPVEALAAELNAQIVYKELVGEVSGMVHTNQGVITIGVNTHHHEVRQRFTIAHELGHLVLHQSENLHIDDKLRSAVNFRNGISSLGVDESEIEANQFAAELLMPESFLLKDIQVVKAREPEAAIQELADRYRVSVQSMSIRLSKLNLVR